MTSLNAYALELSPEEINVLQVAIDHMINHLGELHTIDPSDRDVHRRFHAAHRMKIWLTQETGEGIDEDN